MDFQTEKLITIKIVLEQGRRVNLSTGPITVAQMLVGQSAIFIKSKDHARRIIRRFLSHYLAEGMDIPPGVEDLRRNKKIVKPVIDNIPAKKFYNSAAWASARYLALKKHGGKCQCCGAGSLHGAVLNVDHIKPRSKFPHLALNPDNLQVLCQQCNYGKYNQDQTDWRPEEGKSLRTRHLGRRMREEKRQDVIDYVIQVTDLEETS